MTKTRFVKNLTTEIPKKVRKATKLKFHTRKIDSLKNQFKMKIKANNNLNKKMLKVMKKILINEEIRRKTISKKIVK